MIGRAMKRVLIGIGALTTLSALGLGGVFIAYYIKAVKEEQSDQE